MQDSKLGSQNHNFEYYIFSLAFTYTYETDPVIVLVLERHYIAGGCLHTWESSGYEWDTGVHYVGESMHQDTKRSTGQVLKFLTDGELEWEEMDAVFDTVKLRKDGSEDVESFPIEKRSNRDGKSWDKLESMLLEKFPEEQEAISKVVFQFLSR